MFAIVVLGARKRPFCFIIIDEVFSMKHYSKKFIELPGVDERVAYIEAGSGDRDLLLIHGNMSGSLHYTPIIERLEGEFHIYAPDMKGYGDTTYRHHFTHLHEQADLIIEFCDKLGLKHLRVGGWSTGGAVTMSVAARRPDLVDQIVFFDSISLRGHPYFQRDEKGKPIYGKAYDSIEHMSSSNPQKATIEWMENKDFEKMTGLWNLVIYSGGPRPTEEENRLYMEETFKQRCLGESYWALSTFNITDTPTFYAKGDGLYHNIHQPILCFWGENDISVPWFNTHELPDYFGDQLKLVKVPHAGHSPISDQPDLLVEEMRKFLK